MTKGNIETFLMWYQEKTKQNIVCNILKMITNEFRNLLITLLTLFMSQSFFIFYIHFFKHFSISTSFIVLIKSTIWKRKLKIMRVRGVLVEEAAHWVLASGRSYSWVLESHGSVTRSRAIQYYSGHCVLSKGRGFRWRTQKPVYMPSLLTCLYASSFSTKSNVNI